MWLSAIKLAVSAGSKIYANKQKTKMAMSDAQLMHAERMARGDEAYQGKLLEARQSDWKDEAVLIILSLPPSFIIGRFIIIPPPIFLALPPILYPLGVTCLLYNLFAIIFYLHYGIFVYPLYHICSPLQGSINL